MKKPSVLLVYVSLSCCANVLTVNHIGFALVMSDLNIVAVNE